MRTTIRCFEDRENFFPEFEAHQARHGMPAPVLGSEVRVLLGQFPQRGEQGARLIETECFRITIAQHRVRIGAYAGICEGIAEVSDPRVQTAQRCRYALALAEETKDPLLRDAILDAADEPLRAEILGDDAVNMGEAVLAFGLEQADSDCVIYGLAEAKRRDVGDVEKAIGCFRVRTRVYAGPVAQQLGRAYRAGPQQELVVVSVSMPNPGDGGDCPP